MNFKQPFGISKVLTAGDMIMYDIERFNDHRYTRLNREFDLPCLYLGKARAVINSGGTIVKSHIFHSQRYGFFVSPIKTFVARYNCALFFHWRDGQRID